MMRGAGMLLLCCNLLVLSRIPSCTCFERIVILLDGYEIHTNDHTGNRHELRSNLTTRSLKIVIFLNNIIELLVLL